MALILNIETSGKICSVAVCDEGQVMFQLEDHEGMNHAEKLGPFIARCMEEITRRELKLEAVAVSIGPGSYTGLRIGLSMAKGICFGLDIPLIAVDTLQTLAVKAMFRNMDFDGSEILIPMVDARRMEVFAGAYDFALNELIEAGPVILDENSFADLAAGGKRLVFIGDGASKARDLLKIENAEWIPDLKPVARDMMALSEKAFREGKFADVAYSVPRYLKNWQPTIPRKRL